MHDPNPDPVAKPVYFRIRSADLSIRESFSRARELHQANPNQCPRSHVGGFQPRSKMADSPDDIGEISAMLLRPETLQHKSLLYNRVLLFQEQSVNDPHAIETLAQHSHLLVSIIASDIFSDDEETAALALKCLGFMIYHPYVVSSISDDDTSLVIESLVKLITITKMKAIYNLGAWCIAIQQLNTSLIGRHMDSLLRAVTHALDNLVGSMSTTYEAMQAVIKLATQHREKMREMSHIWAPLIYRRLLSADKREKDIAERCLLKIKPWSSLGHKEKIASRDEGNDWRS